MKQKIYSRGRVPGGQRAEFNEDRDNQIWGLQSHDLPQKYECNHMSQRGTQDWKLCFACWVASLPKRGPIVEVFPRGATICVSCGAVPVVGDDTCSTCQAAMDARIAKAMAELPAEPSIATRDRTDYVRRSTCVLSISGDSGSVRQGRTGRVKG